MFLKQLYINGFKSFADKTTIEFVPGITAIVGPNGSGKSNISDAIRWVLGEQSARNIRGNRMEDIIFSGTDRRHPLGMAEVSLTLDNSDGRLPVEYNEVTVTRRFFRSGDSEFFINRAPCRLKDIQELFMDTGLGKEALSHIGQGQIDAVLSARPEYRRMFLEEAAGITKYKTRKAEAVRKLEDTDQNLLRVNDLLLELEERLGPLSLEAEKTRRYNELVEQLRVSETSLLALRWRRLSESWKNWETERNTYEKDLLEQESQIARIEGERMKVKERAQELRAAADQVAASLSECESDLTSKEQRIGILNERIDQLKTRARETEASLSHLREQIEENAKELSEKADAVKVGTRHLEELKADLQSFLDKKTSRREQLGGLEENLRLKREEVLKGTTSLAALESKQTYIQSQLVNLEERRILLSARLAAEQSEHGELSQTVNESKVALAKVAGEIEKTRAGQEKLRTRQNHLEARLRSQRKKVVELQSMVDSKSSRLQALKDLEETYEGYHPGVRQVMASGLEGIHGVVAELFKVPVKLALALEVALGGALQNVVVKDSDTAKRAISYLKGNRSGRATFLPLSDLTSSRLTFPAEKFPGVIGVALDLVEYDPRYEAAMQYLLGRVVVAENLDTAVALSKRLRGFSRIVTTEGELIVPGGAITGGSFARNTGLLLRRQEASKLEEHLGEMKARLAEERQTEEALEAELRSAEQNQKNLLEDLHRLEIERTAAQNRLVQAEKDLRRIEDVIKNLSSEMSELAIEREELQEEARGASEAVSRVKENLETLGSEVKQLEGRLQEEQEGDASLEESLTSLRVSVAAQEERCSRLRSEFTSLREKGKDLERALSQGEERLLQDKEDIVRWEEEIASLISQKKSAMNHAERLRARSGENRRALEELAKTEEEILAVLRREEGVRSTLRDKLHSVELEMGRLDMQTRQLEERLRENWNVSLEEIGSLRPQGSESSLASAVSRARTALQALGPVNPAAIEQYETQKTRYEYLSRQQKDLVEAQKSLREAIAAIDRTSEERFLATLSSVKENFRKMFTRLFGGGSADLTLTDESNILESGVEVFVQPPGKKPQHLLLLSGGERALTAIALLFAVLSVSPSPFCVLDEIDAALDDANLSRYAEILNEFAHDIQFIVVTHRQATMHQAGCLYGVTTDKNGISRLVSVKLEQHAKQQAR